MYLIEYHAHGVHFCSKIHKLMENWASGVKKNVLERRQVICLREGEKDREREAALHLLLTVAGERWTARMSLM